MTRAGAWRESGRGLGLCLVHGADHLESHVKGEKVTVRNSGKRLTARDSRRDDPPRRLTVVYYIKRLPLTKRLAGKSEPQMTATLSRGGEGDDLLADGATLDYSVAALHPT